MSHSDQPIFQLKPTVRQIWKYQVGPDDAAIAMPYGAKFLSVQMQRGEPQMWFMVDPEEKPTQRRFVTFGTGHPFTDDGSLRFLATFQPSPSLVFHLFERLGV